MATDATGTPSTNLLIPKYATAGDAPSGKGLNAIVDYLDTLLAKGFVILSAKGDIVYSSAANVAARLPIGATGNVLTVAGGVPTWAAPSSSTVSIGTSIPASPSDGDQYVLTDNTTTPTYAWLLQYSSTASKWIFIGGSPATQFITTSETSSSTGYTDLATVGPSVTAPRSGTYMVRSFADARASTGGGADVYLGVKVGASAPVDLTRLMSNWQSAGAGSGGGGERQLSGVTASDVIKLQYRVGGALTGTWENRAISVIPVWVT